MAVAVSVYEGETPSSSVASHHLAISPSRHLTLLSVRSGSPSQPDRCRALAHCRTAGQCWSALYPHRWCSLQVPAMPCDAPDPPPIATCTHPLPVYNSPNTAHPGTAVSQWSAGPLPNPGLDDCEECITGTLLLKFQNVLSLTDPQTGQGRRILRTPRNAAAER